MAIRLLVIYKFLNSSKSLVILLLVKKNVYSRIEEILFQNIPSLKNTNKDDVIQQMYPYSFHYLHPTLYILMRLFLLALF